MTRLSKEQRIAEIANNTVLDTNTKMAAIQAIIQGTTEAVETVETVEAVEAVEAVEMKVQVIISEQHTILAEQESKLNQNFGQNWERRNIPADGLSLHEQIELVDELQDEVVVFLSPIPVMIATRLNVPGPKPSTYLFHNDKREKKELPNGKVISVTAQDGWELVKFN